MNYKIFIKKKLVYIYRLSVYVLCFVVRFCRQSKSALPHGYPMNGNEEIKQKKTINEKQVSINTNVFQIINIILWNETQENETSMLIMFHFVLSNRWTTWFRPDQWNLNIDFEVHLKWIGCTFPFRELWKTEWIVIVCPFLTFTI